MSDSRHASRLSVSGSSRGLRARPRGSRVWAHRVSDRGIDARCVVAGETVRSGLSGQITEVLVCERRDARAARALFTRALTVTAPVEVTTDRAPVYPRVLDELLPAGRHVVERYANNAIDADHGRLTSRLRPMRRMKTIRSLRTIAAGHAVVQNLRRGHYELTAQMSVRGRLRAGFTELANSL